MDYRTSLLVFQSIKENLSKLHANSDTGASDGGSHIILGFDLSKINYIPGQEKEKRKRKNI